MLDAWGCCESCLVPMFLVTLLALPEVTDLNRRQGQFGIFMFRLFLDQCPAAGVYFDHHRYSHMMCQRRAHKWGYAGLDITLEARSTRRNRGGRFFLGSVKSVLQLFKSHFSTMAMPPNHQLCICLSSIECPLLQTLNMKGAHFMLEYFDWSKPLAVSSLARSLASSFGPAGWPPSLRGARQ